MNRPTQEAARFLDLIQKDKFLIASTEEDKVMRDLILNHYKNLCKLSKEDIKNLNTVFPNLDLK